MKIHLLFSIIILGSVQARFTSGEEDNAIPTTTITSKRDESTSITRGGKTLKRTLPLVCLGMGLLFQCDPATAGNVNSIPVVSQAKSAVQAMTGDLEGARRTQEDFSRGCPGVSQIRSAVEAGCGDSEAARQTQLYFARELEGMADALPGVGHVKGAVHYGLGQKDRGDRAMKSASRTVAVVGAGIAGGPGAAAAAGVAYDGLVTGIESGIHGKFRPEGGIFNAAHRIAKGDHAAGHLFGKYHEIQLEPCYSSLMMHIIIYRCICRDRF